MAGSSLILLIDDIASVLDDVTTLTKVAARKTAGVLGDDLALNAQQVTGVTADRELPVVWAVAKGSLRNKLILVPAALAISAFAPWAVMPLLMVGGAFLCYEGFEKLAHRFLHDAQEDQARRDQMHEARLDPAVDLVAVEKQKIEGAVRTDFILSAEIIAITLGAVATATFLTQVLVVSGIALVMTVGVYGVVAGIVKLDDAAVYLYGRPGEGAWARLQHGVGAMLLRATPWLMKGLSVAGTAAMFLVGGGILVHGIGPLHHAIQAMVHEIAAWSDAVPALLRVSSEMVLNALAGVVAGALVLATVTAVQRMRGAAQA